MLQTCGNDEMVLTTVGYRVETLSALILKDVDIFNLIGVLVASTSLFGRQEDFFIEGSLRC
jgi:hypothetical protein